MQHATVIFRTKWVWIWLRLPSIKVPSGGAFFGRIEYPRFQKKKKSVSDYDMGVGLDMHELESLSSAVS